MYGIGRAFKRYFGGISLTAVKRELNRVGAQPRFKAGYTSIFNKPFKFHDGLSFEATYKELFQGHIYKFKPSNTARTIIDCGANMGLSVLYFSLNYPDHKIIAFEPDPVIFDVLKENVERFGLKNVTIHQKAVWIEKGTLKFFTDGGMGGRVESPYLDQYAQEVEAVALRDFITADVDMLKIDIEGAEEPVLNSCKDILHSVNHLFFEYHNHRENPQTLHLLLALVSTIGFTYYIKESDVRKRPFIDENIIGESFDMALNVFCYKKGTP